ncbi:MULTISPECIES: hypothetical protein, partial [unclassified Microcystis]|uniref:hypothetical protein n=1 Tax=unclassified Microcystis TaxID=2643300 RepID=UPI0025858439
RPYRTRADENARFGSTILSKSCTCLARKATKPLPYLHFTFIQPTLNTLTFGDLGSGDETSIFP